MVESTDDFCDRIAVLMRGKHFNGNGELVAARKEKKPPIYKTGKPTYGHNNTKCPDKVNILDARSAHPTWHYSSINGMIDVTPSKGAMLIRVSDPMLQPVASFTMSFKHFRSLFHWGMPTAQKEDK